MPDVRVVEPEDITDPALVIAMALRYCVATTPEQIVVECYHLTMHSLDPVDPRGRITVQAVLVYDMNAYFLVASIPGSDRLRWGFVNDRMRTYVPKNVMMSAFYDLEFFITPLYEQHRRPWLKREERAAALLGGRTVRSVADGYPL